MSHEWRPMHGGDLAAVETLGKAVHLNHPEDAAVFAERLALCPQGCFVLAGPDGLHGYAISHPWLLGTPPALNTQLGALPAVADTWYIHDLALSVAARGSGAAATMVARLAGGCNLATMSLIAVGRSPGFWARQGFHPAPLPARKLASYGAGAQYMIRRRS